MRLDDLTIALRLRAAWEASDLGIALVRTHARSIWLAWVIVTLPVFALLNLVAGLAHVAWLAALLLWWLKPVFDRIVLFVLSRAVFGEAPRLRETLHAQRTWGWRAIVPWLFWRRLHPGRAMLLAVDLLEGVGGAQRGERVRVLGRGGGSPSVMLTLICANFEMMLSVSIVLLALMFVPVEFLSESARALWRTMVESPPAWAQWLLNACGWIAMTIVEPFYVGAGFGLYLNRRMQLEGWDIELAFRRIAARLTAGFATAAMLALAFMALQAPLHAAEPAPASSPESAQAMPATSDGDTVRKETTLPELFGEHYRDDGAAFEEAVRKAYAGDDLSPKARAWIWKRRNPDVEGPATQNQFPAWMRAFGGAIGWIARYGLWILVAVVLALLLANHRRWLPWIGDRMAALRSLEEIRAVDPAPAEALPTDVPAAVRALLQQRRTRAALALLYRASVERLADALGTPLPPGATESQCLRHARSLGDARHADLFARVVRGWQAAAYAQQAPSVQEVEMLLAAWSAQAPKVAA
ncbi:DUF4129 domain-containing protein [Dokdonella sp.]|uniref:DUF4129 domain-containing protein n=1 Tax=Dokdonella sp. TaxID=2291710 RepID=UPI003784AE82